MAPRLLSEEAFIALLRQVYHNAQWQCGSRHNLAGAVAVARSPIAAAGGRSSLTTTTTTTTTTIRTPATTRTLKRYYATTKTKTTTTTNTNKTTAAAASASASATRKTPPRQTWKVKNINGGGGGGGGGGGSASKTSRPPPKQIAVLGGGITGLTTAHYLARFAGPDVHVTLYEASDRLGGWIEAVRVPAGAGDGSGSDGDVLLQQGPRMLRSGTASGRYDDLVLYDVIASLNLQDELRYPEGPTDGPSNIPSDSRYIFYPDHLVKLPSSADWKSLDAAVAAVRGFLSEPLWDGCARAALNYWRRRDVSGRSALLETAAQQGQGPPASSFSGAPDESAGAFLSRIFGGEERPVRNIVSGVMHGIYGGDVWKLSAKHTVLERSWYRTAAPRPRGQLWMPRKDWFLLWELLDGADGGINANAASIIEMAECAVDDEWKLLAFEDGLVTLVRALVSDLEARPNVTIRTGEPVTSLAYKAGRVLVETSKTGAKKPAQYNHVISTLFSKQLAQIVQPANSLPSLAETHAVTIMVVNLWYPGERDLLAGNHGFGYLVPSSTPDNDEGVLGVLFDSDIDPTHPDANPYLDREPEQEQQQQQAESSSQPPRPAGTKLTVMLGGHHWDGWQHLPNEEAGIALAKSAVQKHLGIAASEETEVVARAKLCRDCLPQHFVGHRERMAGAHEELRDAFHGRLSVAGPSYTAVGVVPAMRAGWEAALKAAHPRRADAWARPLSRSPAPAASLVAPGSRPKRAHDLLDSWVSWWHERLAGTPDIDKLTVIARVLPRRGDGVGEEGEEEEEEGHGSEGAVTSSSSRNNNNNKNNQKKVRQGDNAAEPPLPSRLQQKGKPPGLELQPHTGLEEFAEPEDDTMIPVWQRDLYFRDWTAPGRRLAGDRADAAANASDRRWVIELHELASIDRQAVVKGVMPQKPIKSKLCTVAPPRSPDPEKYLHASKKG